MTKSHPLSVAILAPWLTCGAEAGCSLRCTLQCQFPNATHLVNGGIGLTSVEQGELDLELGQQVREGLGGTDLEQNLMDGRGEGIKSMGNGDKVGPANSSGVTAGLGR